MPLKRTFRENWLTRKPLRNGVWATILLVLLLAFGKLAEYPASADLVYGKGEIWRAWTTLFVHADPGHLLANVFLFAPFAYALITAYGYFLFPVVGFFVGGLVNLVVLKTMPAATTLVGASGVVYWMGAAWITLAFLVDRRDRMTVRLLKAFGVSMLLFLPDKYRPEVSYLTHGLGYLAGVISALVYYAMKRSEFRRAERYDYRYDFEAHWDPRTNRYSAELIPDEIEAANAEN